MSWSLTLSPRLTPAPLHGVSRETVESFRASTRQWPAVVAASAGFGMGAKFDFPEQLSVPCCALLALGVPTEIEELPIRSG